MSCDQLGVDAELGDGERSKLHLEGDEPVDGRVDSLRHGPAPWSASTVAAMRRRMPSMKVPVPTAGSATVTSGEARPAAAAEVTAQHVIDEANHRPDDFAAACNTSR